MKPKPLPQWMALGLPLQMYTWIAAFFTMIGALIFMYFYGYWSVLESNNHWTRMFFLLGAMVDESLPEIKTIKSHGGRLFLAIFLLCFFVLTIGYRGGLVANLSIPFVPRPIDTVKEVIADPRPVISFGENFKNDLSKSDDPIIGQILENYKFHYDFDGALRNLSLGTVIMAETLQSTLYKIRAQFTNKFGETTIHTLRECLTPYRVAFALQKHSIYKKPFSRVIQKLKEGGFVNKWLNNEMDLVARLQTKTSVLSTAEAKPLSLNEFQAAGLVYLCFLALSLIGLGLELILHYSKRLKATPTMYGRWNTEY
ncbi:uncharacterized protein LOC131880621 [Tigriopus californicus]|uniref:uncharacterized protein LOC131880621 n=1 Tax=Tigriopus californicus TaxID=6832 RepID=UPI0027DA97D4|nr:uncharacterized protein LOC131880621 [Tigriopus californicus]